MSGTKKTILVTGATSGIGRATAIELARRGHEVIASGRKTEILDAMASEHGVKTLVLDVTSREAIEKVAGEVESITDGHGIDVLVNNAGFGRLAPMELITDDDMLGQFETNVFGLVRVTQALLPGMKRRGSGKIINISSVVGRLSIPMQGIYCATKHAVEALSDAWRVELRGFGIKVVLVEPGAIQTSFGATALANEQKYKDAGADYNVAIDNYHRLMEKMYASSPGPERVARCVARIVEKRSPRARYVVPWTNRPMIFLYKATPSFILDRLMARMLGL
ncbi:MAG: SDR family oxidoreductase [Deltaproteobacteria bacterium]|nr:MAG: SDR family oxidoreductase [Deltaproteobacteria bacterium]